MGNFDIVLNEDDKIIDFLTGNILEPKPEEFVRQQYLRVLHFEYQYPKNVMAREVPIYRGSSELLDDEGKPIRADIVVYRSKRACSKRDQGNIVFIVECKAPNKTSGYSQLVSYIYNTGAEGGVWFNGDDVDYYRRIIQPNNELKPWIGIPRSGEAWDALGRSKKVDLIQPKDVKGLLKRCHNRLHSHGVNGEEEDLTMDMVRLILAKAMDEENTGDYPEFYCTEEEYNSNAGRIAVADRIRNLFEDVKKMNSEVFGEHEQITVDPRAICYVVTELQRYRLLSDFADSQDWDIMGHAYEEYTATYLKRERGQFFTNRLIIDFLVAALDPNYQDTFLDPAGGSGGFLTGIMRFVRRKILSEPGSPTSKQRQLDRHRNRLFMIEISRRLVKVAKTAMILNGDGHAGMTQGDSLGPYSAFNDTILAQCNRGTPTIILTNPPFAGVGEGRISDENTLDQFDCGKRWVMKEGEYVPTEDLLSEGAPPELLFFERCIDWLAPDGKLGIVLPKSFLDTQTYRPARHLLFNKCKLLAVINCHKNTFQPHTGVRTCLILVHHNISFATLYSACSALTLHRFL